METPAFFLRSSILPREVLSQLIFHILLSGMSTQSGLCVPSAKTRTRSASCSWPSPSNWSNKEGFSLFPLLLHLKHRLDPALLHPIQRVLGKFWATYVTLEPCYSSSLGVTQREPLVVGFLQNTLGPLGQLICRNLRGWNLRRNCKELIKIEPIIDWCCNLRST